MPYGSSHLLGSLPQLVQLTPQLGYGGCRDPRDVGLKRLRGRCQRPAPLADEADGRVPGSALELADGDRGARRVRRGSGDERDAQPGGDQFAHAGRAVGLELDPRGEPLGGGRLDEDPMQPAVGRQTNGSSRTAARLTRGPAAASAAPPAAPAVPPAALAVARGWPGAVTRTR